MEDVIKCSFEEHKEINAIKYCPECRIYMCNKCDNFHSSLFKNHHPNNLENEEEIFTGICKEKNHYKLKYYCKNHNQLCCVECIAKLNKEGEGQHKDCEVFYLENIKEEKKNKLKENIKHLGNLSNELKQSIDELQILFEKISKNKEALKLNKQKVFTKVRNKLNEREDEIFLEVDKQFDKLFMNEDIFKKSTKLANMIKYH